MPSNRVTAEARFARAQKRAEDTISALRDVEAESLRVAERTAKLRALRLARDASEAVEAEKRKAEAQSRPAAKRKRVSVA